MGQYLMSFQQGLSAGDVIGEFVRAHQRHHRVDPRHQVAVVRQEPVLFYFMIILYIFIIYYYYII